MFQPKQKILRKMWKGGKKYCVTGYEIFDPKFSHSCTGRNGGRVPLSIKQGLPIGEILIIAGNQEGKPIKVKLNEICHLQDVPKQNWVDFADLFGLVSLGAVKLKGYKASEEEDSSLGVQSLSEE